MKSDNPEGIPSVHLALQGHFPGNPIVPGVVLLQEVMLAARACFDREIVLSGIPSLKFLAPLRPNMPFSVEFSAKGNCVKFTCSSGDLLIASGQLDLA